MVMSPGEIDQVVVMRERDHWRSEYGWAISELRAAAYVVREQRLSGRLTLAAMAATAIENELTRAEILTWAHIESISTPGHLVGIVLEEVAPLLGVSVDTVSRAVRRLTELDLIADEFVDKRHRVGPKAVSP